MRQSQYAYGGMSRRFGMSKNKYRKYKRYGKHQPTMKTLELNYADFKSSAYGSTASVNHKNMWATGTTYVEDLRDGSAFVVWEQDSTVPSRENAPLTNITQGTSVNSRIGKRILVKDINISGMVTAVYKDVGVDPASNLKNYVVPKFYVYFYLVRHRASKGSYPNAGELYERVNQAGVSDLTTNLRVKQFTTTYDIVKKWMLVVEVDPEMNVAGTHLVGSGFKPFTKNIKVNKYVTYNPNASTGAIPDHMDGGLYLGCHVCSEPLVFSQCHLKFQGMARVNFIDV